MGFFLLLCFSVWLKHVWFRFAPTGALVLCSELKAQEQELLHQQLLLQRPLCPAVLRMPAGHRCSQGELGSGYDCDSFETELGSQETILQVTSSNWCPYWLTSTARMGKTRKEPTSTRDHIIAGEE